MEIEQLPAHDQRMVKAHSVLWRRMMRSDLTSLKNIGDTVHPDYPEDAAIIAERLLLYPTGCLVLAGDQGIQGYAVAHPWLFGRVPCLNTLLRSLPDHADTFYIHDLALLPHVRSGGLGTKAVELLGYQAKSDGFTSMSLVAVGSSPRFWLRHGFQVLQQKEMQKAVSTYKDASLMSRVLV